MQLVFVGENVIDHYTNLNQQFIGGNVINTMMNFKKYTDFNLSYVGPLATDTIGDTIKELLTVNHINLDYVSYPKGKTAASYLEVVKGERIFKGYEPGVLAGLTLSKDQLAFIHGQDHIHASLMGGLMEQLPAMKGKGTISFDFSILRNMKLIESTMKSVDYGFFSVKSFNHMEKEEMIKIKSFGGRQVIFLLGNQGSVVYDGLDFYDYPPEKINVIDSLGAGDSYIAGYMAAVLRGASINEAMKLGTAWASNTCQHFGGFQLN